MIHCARLLATLATVAALGCGGSDDAQVYPVKGRVTFNGKPMAGGGSIAFAPINSQTGKAAGGEIRPDGTYELTTYSDSDGSMPGDFRVTIMQVTVQEPPTTSDDGGKPQPAPVATVAEADRIPAIYSDPYNSPLTAKVEAKELNELNFELERQPTSTRPPGAG
jgi:hypothetical protein